MKPFLLAAAFSVLAPILPPSSPAPPPPSVTAAADVIIGPLGTATQTTMPDGRLLVSFATPAAMDAFFAAEPRNQARRFTFTAGAFDSIAGIQGASNWTFHGAGRSLTSVRRVSPGYGGGETGWGQSVFYSATPISNFEISDLTVDGGATAYVNCPVAKAFTLPASGPFTVQLANTTNLVVGYAYYFHGAAQADGTKAYYGTYRLTAISGNAATLQADATIPGVRFTAATYAGVTVPATATLWPFSDAAGNGFNRPPLWINTGGGLYLHDLAVVRGARPKYEGPAGICIAGSGPANFGNRVQRCTTSDLYGTCVTAAEMMSGGGGTVCCNWTDDDFQGNGFYQGMGGWGYSYSCVERCRFLNFETPVFCDSATCAHVAFHDDHERLSSLGGGGTGFYIQGGNSYADLDIDGCLIERQSTAQGGIYLGTVVRNARVHGNRITGPGYDGIRVSCPTVSLTGNIIDVPNANLTLWLDPGITLAFKSGNTDQNGNAL